VKEIQTTTQKKKEDKDVFTEKTQHNRVKEKTAMGKTVCSNGAAMCSIICPMMMMHMSQTIVAYALNRCPRPRVCKTASRADKTLNSVSANDTLNAGTQRICVMWCGGWEKAKRKCCRQQCVRVFVRPVWSPSGLMVRYDGDGDGNDFCKKQDKTGRDMSETASVITDIQLSCERQF
jgi:hypothetical protein